MKFVDIIKALLIVVIFGLLFFSSILTNGLQDIKDNWPKYRCSPTYMPFASYLGYDTMENFSYCVGKYSKRFNGIFSITNTIYFRKYGFHIAKSFRFFSNG